MSQKSPITGNISMAKLASEANKTAMLRRRNVGTASFPQPRHDSRQNCAQKLLTVRI
jgi:hypothetical protein